jgi:predicted Zn-dependent protease
MSYSREQVKTITDKVLNMCKADGVEVEFSGGERAATRYANSTITANLIENDQEVRITVYYGQKSATTSVHQFDDATLKAAIEQVQALARRKPDNPETMPLVKPPQDYVQVDATLPTAVNFGGFTSGIVSGLSGFRRASACTCSIAAFNVASSN